MDYLKVFKEFNDLSKSYSSSLKRCREVNDIFECKGLYILAGMNKVEKNNWKQFARVVFMLSSFSSNKIGATLGASLTNVHESRIKRISKARDSDRALKQLKSAIKIQGRKGIAVDLQKACEQIFYWGKKNGTQLLIDYFMSIYK